MRSYEEFRAVLDSVFQRDDVRGIWGDELDGDVAYYIGHAFARMPAIAGSAHPRIAVGRDMRIGSPVMAAQLIRGIRAAGGDVHDLGMCGSEMIYFATGEPMNGFDGGAMVTASHNPPEYAGAKFVAAGARPLDTDELRSLKAETARQYASDLQCMLRGPAPDDLAAPFVEKLLAVAGLSSDGGDASASVALKVVVEAGNGMGGVTFDPVAKRLEGLLPGTEFVFSDPEPDGRFPICTPNPLLPEYADLLANRVRAEGADLGICFDGDADRAGFVDDEGQLIDASLVSTVLLHMLSQGRGDGEGQHVMGNLNSSLLLTDSVASSEWKGSFCWTPVGHAKIKGLMRAEPYLDAQTGQSHVLFGSEHSGHYFYPEFFYADSGMTTAIFMVRRAREILAAGGKLSAQLTAARSGYFASGELNETLRTDAEAKDKIKKIADTHAEGTQCVRRGIVEGSVAGTHEVKEFGAHEPYDAGALAALDLRMDSAQGEDPRWWFSVRKSGNEPKLRLNVEATHEGKMQEIRDHILGIMRA